MSASDETGLPPDQDGTESTGAGATESTGIPHESASVGGAETTGQPAGTADAPDATPGQDDILGQTRDNGLRATSWVALGECEPHVADELLAVLAAVMIPAYARPAQRQRAGDAPSDPGPRRRRNGADRLFVESSRRREAEHLVLGRLRAEPAPDRSAAFDLAEQDRAFAAIVASFSAPDAVAPVRIWPAAEDVTADGASHTAPAPQTPPPALPPLPLPPPPARQQPGLLDPGGLLYDSTIGEGTRPHGADPFEGDDHHYVPPVLPPSPPLQKATKAAWVAILAGLFCIIAPAFGLFSPANIAELFGALLILGGIGTLIAQLRDDDDDIDRGDGAVV